MAEKPVQRRLAAILAADVVGYSRLMGEDEAGALAAVRTLRTEVIEPNISEHQGGLFKAMGDGFLVEFPSVVNAVACAIAIQRALVERNADLPEDRTMQLRIGVNLGDVIVDGQDLFGDGVNVAARLESLAEPGGVLVSGTAYDHLKGKIDSSFEDLGPQKLKNISEPVRTYRVTGMPVAAGHAKQPVSDKPLIAVLPFTNMSADPEQEYFSDGITEDIITELSRFRSFEVIARHSSFAFKGKPMTVQQIGQQLSVNYVLEGSIRRAGNKVRITAQLIDVQTSAHLWAERMDRDLQDVFAMQDEVTERIVTTIADRLDRTEQKRVAISTTAAMRAYDLVLKARSIVANTAADNELARSLYKKALESEPHNVPALTGLAWSYLIDLGSRWNGPKEALLTEAENLGRRAIALDESDYRGHLVLAAVMRNKGQFDLANRFCEQGLSLNPNNAEGCAQAANLSLALGRFSDALTWIQRAIHLNPLHPAWYLYILGESHYGAREYERALAPLRTATSRFPNYITPRRHLAAALAQLGRTDEARSEIETARKIDPQISVSLYGQTILYQNEEDRQHYLEGLRKAGLPE